MYEVAKELKMATERNAQVYEMVESELRQDRGASNEYLFSRAVSIDASIAELTPQQFNARYPLVVKRKFAREGASVPSMRDSGVVHEGTGPTAKKVSPFLADRVSSARNGHESASSVLESISTSRKPRSGGGRRRVARAKVEGPSIVFDDTALRTLVLRMMRDVADASTNPGKLVEVVARVDSYAADIKETARISDGGI